MCISNTILFYTYKSIYADLFIYFQFLLRNSAINPNFNVKLIESKSSQVIE